MNNPFNQAAGYALSGILFLFLGCGGSAGPAGKPGHTALVESAPEPSGAHCAQGGFVLRSGIDANDNGVLDPAEVAKAAYVCNGAGKDSLVKTAIEPAGPNCAEGGYLIQAGVDSNGDGALQPSEVRASEYVCNGKTGAGGSDSLVVMQPEPDGGHCVAGGLRIDAGVDSNHNGALDPSEARTQYVCNGRDGHDSLVLQVQLPVGSTACPSGGIELDSGTDLNDDGILQQSEVTQRSTVCLPALCPNPRYSLNGQVACPVDAQPLAAGLGPYASMAVSESGQVYLSQSGIIDRVSPAGQLTSSFFTPPYPTDEAGSDSLVMLGEDLYVLGTELDQAGIAPLHVGKVSANGSYTSIYSASRQGLTGVSLSVFDASTLFLSLTDGSGTAGSETLWSITGPGTATKIGTSVTGEAHADPVSHRLYFASGPAVMYESLPITGDSVPQTLWTLPEAGAQAAGLTTDELGRVYVGCVIVDESGEGLPFQPCALGSVYRINADGTGLLALTDSSRAPVELGYQANGKVLHILQHDGNAESVERLRIER